MPLNRSSLFLEVIEGLSKNPHIGDGNIHKMAREILHKSSHFLKLERVNIWLTNENDQFMNCLLAYQRNADKYYQEPPLEKTSCPKYFAHISKNEFIISNNSQKEHCMEELLHNYLIPNDICAMIEVPIIMGGKLRGIICFENTSETRNWTNDEQHFGIALAHLITLTLENEEKNKYREELEKVVKEKSLLLNEMNHRLKNNLTIINALIKSELNKAKDAYHKALFMNLTNKTFTLSSLLDFTIESNGDNTVDLKLFTTKLFKNINETYGFELNVKSILNLSEVQIKEAKAMPCALILNEILVNCYKHAFKKNRENLIEISLNQNKDGVIKISIKDNGSGIPKVLKNRGMGIDSIEGLSDQIDAILGIDSSNKGTKITLEIG
jgi:two-component sensor histidine kinase